MHARQSLPDSLRRLAGERGGALTRQECLRAGLTSPVIDRLAKPWRRPVPGVYVLTSDTGTLPFLTRAWVGVLAAGAGARLGHTAAAALHGLVDEEPRIITIYVPARRQVRLPAGYRVVRERKGVRRASSAAQPPRTGVEDTVLDVASDPRLGIGVSIVMTACQNRRTTPERLRRALDQRARHPHRTALRELLDDIEHGTTSFLDRRHLLLVEQPHGLPSPQRQFIVQGTGHAADGAWPQWRTLLELDGWRYHRGRVTEDLWLDLDHAADGWVSMRVGSFPILDEPCAFAWREARVLQRRGWTGHAHRCPQCPTHVGSDNSVEG